MEQMRNKRFDPQTHGQVAALGGGVCAEDRQTSKETESSGRTSRQGQNMEMATVPAESDDRLERMPSSTLHGPAYPTPWPRAPPGLIL